MKRKSLIPLLLFWCFTMNAQNIFRTACRGNMGRLDSLLTTTNINTQDNRGRSLLHWAVACKKKEVFEHLLQKGITTNLQDNEGVTPLYMAVRFQQMEFFDRLTAMQTNTR